MAKSGAKAIAVVDSDAVVIGELYTRAKRGIVDSVLSLLECGRRLDAKKKELGHGAWLPWLAENEAVLGFNRFNAARLISKSRNVSSTTHLTDETALLISRELWGNEVNRAKAEAQRAAAIAKTRNIAFEAEALGKFAVLYADPPWRYEHPPMGASNRSIENHYPTMTLDEICAVKVLDIAHDDSVLFMWATSPKLKECFQVLEAWGFDCRTTAVWVKDKIGMGYYFREQHELILVAKRGELPPPDPSARPSSVIDSPRRGHSEKPDEMYGIIDSMYQGDKIAKCELFGRLNLERPEHWAVWGNDVAVAA